MVGENIVVGANVTGLDSDPLIITPDNSHTVSGIPALKPRRAQGHRSVWLLGVERVKAVTCLSNSLQM